MEARENTESKARSGTLNDADIKELCAQRQLIKENFDEGCIKQACYELRVGAVYYDLPGGKRHNVDANDYILIRPKQFLVVITHEVMDLPLNVLGRVLTKGKLFSIGLVPVNTYADPGFKGRLGIVLCNASNEYIKLSHRQPIAKIEFSRLELPVTTQYSGQHGYETEIWPIPHEMIADRDELRRQERIGTPLAELERSYGAEFGGIVERVFRFERYLIIASLASLAMTAVLVGASVEVGWKSAILNIGLSIGANLATAFLVYLATNLRRR